MEALRSPPSHSECLKRNGEVGDAGCPCCFADPGAVVTIPNAQEAPRCSAATIASAPKVELSGCPPYLDSTASAWWQN
jgi:hypothetical protein